mmetsp:Transcript_50046/g.140320  ORF Transcript_50046/g.140320 Transcript_50046/m.140320 type:complete len:156 (-) Transcript_50046:84-551(-)
MGCRGSTVSRTSEPEPQVGRTPLESSALQDRQQSCQASVPEAVPESAGDVAVAARPPFRDEPMPELDVHEAASSKATVGPVAGVTAGEDAPPLEKRTAESAEAVERPMQAGHAESSAAAEPTVAEADRIAIEGTEELQRGMSFDLGCIRCKRPGW